MTPNVHAAAARWTRNLQEVLDVSVRWTIVDWNEYYQSFDRQPPHVGFITWSANTPDPDDFLRVAYRHIQRYFGWGHDLYEQLVEGAKQVTDPEARLRLYRQADAILLEELRAAGLYRQTSQVFAVLLPVKSVGVMGDNRTYADVVALRAVTTDDFMTADWARLPYDLLAKLSNRIVNEVAGVNRVVYDITSKPPGTIEWE